MATGDYCTVASVKDRLGVTDFGADAILTAIVTAASRAVNKACGRVFTQDATTSTRHYEPSPTETLTVDDISTPTGLVVVDYTTTLALDSDFGMFPTDGFMPTTGEPGPYYQLRKFSGISWFQIGRGASVSVTARWGWPAVPPLIVEATYLLVADMWASRNVRYGVLSPGAEGGYALRVRENPQVMAMLADYCRADVKVGLA